MQRVATGIIHVRPGEAPLSGEGLEARLVAKLRGVGAVLFRVPESAMMVRFDRTATTIAEIVREIEDLGFVVTGVAQREPRAVRLSARRRSVVRTGVVDPRREPSRP